MGKVQQKTKEAKMMAAMAGGKGKKKKKLNNLVLFDKPTLDKLEKEIPKAKLITPSIISERLKVNGAVARLGIRYLLDKISSCRLVSTTTRSSSTRAKWLEQAFG